MKDITKLIAEKKGYANLLEELDKKLSGSELNTFLLQFFRNRVKKISPKDLMDQFYNSRFSRPSSVDPINFKKMEIDWLKFAAENDFKPVTLSPLTPLGTCSVVGNVDQNNIVSASRGMEVLSDATNVFALLIAHEFRQQKEKTTLRYVATEKLVRSQSLNNPAHTAHFGIFCMASGGLDKGNYSFELENLFEHINIHFALLSKEFGKENLLLNIYLKEDDKIFYKNLDEHLRKNKFPFEPLIEKTFDSGDYYKLVRFKIFLKYKNTEINLTDGGLVDWSQKLIPNKKHRLIISGSGLELIYKIKQAQL